jgi:hypothetical protein
MVSGGHSYAARFGASGRRRDAGPHPGTAAARRACEAGCCHNLSASFQGRRRETACIKVAVQINGLNAAGGRWQIHGAALSSCYIKPTIECRGSALAAAQASPLEHNDNEIIAKGRK